jgi:superfamily I DNA and/or RNA helicase
VIDVRIDEITIAITFGSLNEIPREGLLELNTFLEERALDKQHQALDAVYYDRAAALSLKQLIAFPRSATLISPVTVLPLPTESSLGVDKIEVLKKALAVRDIMVIKGPPGTGKTRLIEELILQYLVKSPDHRILLSSQTHIALDNVLERVLKRNSNLEIVRIGRLDDPRISQICRPLLLEQKVEAWARKVKSDAESFLQQWAVAHELNKKEADTAIVAERLVKTIGIRMALEMEQANAERSAAQIADTREKRLQETGSSESDNLDRAAQQVATRLAELSTAVAKTRQTEKELRTRLREVSSYGRELSEKQIDEIKEWIDVLLGNGVHENKYRELLELQEEWLVRVGRSSDFFAATLAAAKIVAGTCIGLAGVRGFSEVSYDLCILDEASKATATEALVPMARSRRWILVGDPLQLPPFLDSEFARSFDEMKELEVRETLLDRFIRLLPPPVVEELTTQHRMVKEIGDLISSCFYKGALKSVRSKPDISLAALFPRPVAWLTTSGSEERRERASGQSFENHFECRIVRDVLGRINFILSKKKQRCKVAVMAGYVAQVKAIREFLRDHLHQWTSLDVTCNTVDSFQGQEADVCLYSITRSNAAGQLGFLREKPRLNVALSRARDLLIIIGDSEFCKNAEGDNPFKEVIRHIEGHSDACEVRPTDAN